LATLKVAGKFGIDALTLNLKVVPVTAGILDEECNIARRNRRGHVDLVLIKQDLHLSTRCRASKARGTGRMLRGGTRGKPERNQTRYGRAPAHRNITVGNL
jgi:hypothetical protein